MTHPVRHLIAASTLALVVAAPTQAATPNGGGTAQNGAGVAPSAPAVSTVACVSSGLLRCRTARAAFRGGTIRITGSSMRNAAKVIFKGRASTRRDDTSATPSRLRVTSLDVTVPTKAASGPVTVVDRYGNQTTSRSSIRVSAAPAIDAAPGTGFYAGGRRKPALLLPSAPPDPVTVEVLDGTGAAIGSFESSGGKTTIPWDGTIDGASVESGRYRLRANGTTSSEFVLFDSIFPIRGTHKIAPSRTTSFGGGRGHQGVDSFARCGTTLVAARSGKVQFAGYQSRAGNYLVIDLDGSGVDETYMHMRQPPLVKTGQRVFTGQKIGEVGDTGRASGCHLHFEMWSAPGWYEGGKPLDPQPSLERWDSYE